MKRLIFSITIVFCVMFSLTATATTNFIKEKQNLNFLTEKKESKNLVIKQAEFTKDFENVNETKAAYVFGVCFVNISRPYDVEGMDGTIYTYVDITIRCYGDPNGAIIIVTQEQNP